MVVIPRVVLHCPGDIGGNEAEIPSTEIPLPTPPRLPRDFVFLLSWES